MGIGAGLYFGILYCIHFFLMPRTIVDNFDSGSLLRPGLSGALFCNCEGEKFQEFAIPGSQLQKKRERKTEIVAQKKIIVLIPTLL